MSLITLLTDFGTQDSFVGVMKGVIHSLAPGIEIIGLTHHVPPQDIRTGAFILKTASQYFPAGAIHLAVVDPGVGSLRRPIAADIGEFVYVCPDNGLLSYVLAENTVAQAVTLDKNQYHLLQVSRTFHGRDIFANGVSLETLGTPLDTLQTFALSQPSVSGDTLIYHVIYIDVFGSAFTDLTEDMAAQWSLSAAVIEVSGRVISSLSDSYSRVPEGEALALFGRNGHLEIVICSGNAQGRLGIAVGDEVRIRTHPVAGGEPLALRAASAAPG